jgi:hypothetical protein
MNRSPGDADALANAAQTLNAASTLVGILDKLLNVASGFI